MAPALGTFFYTLDLDGSDPPDITVSKYCRSSVRFPRIDSEEAAPNPSFNFWFGVPAGVPIVASSLPPSLSSVHIHSGRQLKDNHIGLCCAVPLLEQAVVIAQFFLASCSPPKAETGGCLAFPHGG